MVKVNAKSLFTQGRRGFPHDINVSCSMRCFKEKKTMKTGGHLRKSEGREKMGGQLPTWAKHPSFPSFKLAQDLRKTCALMMWYFVQRYCTAGERSLSRDVRFAAIVLRSMHVYRTVQAAKARRKGANVFRKSRWPRRQKLAPPRGANGRARKGNGPGGAGWWFGSKHHPPARAQVRTVCPPGRAGGKRALIKKEGPKDILQ